MRLEKRGRLTLGLDQGLSLGTLRFWRLQWWDPWLSYHVILDFSVDATTIITAMTINQSNSVDSQGVKYMSLMCLIPEAVQRNHIRWNQYNV
jgi:hypothetical protein